MKKLEKFLKIEMNLKLSVIECSGLKQIKYGIFLLRV